MKNFKLLAAATAAFFLWLWFKEKPNLDNLTPAARLMLDRLLAYAASKGYSVTVASGYRSPEYQKSLQERWDRGDRAGLVVRPASSSPHTRGNAVDLSAATWVLEDLGAWAVENGYRWGGTFGPTGSAKYDPVHFDVE